MASKLNSKFVTSSDGSKVYAEALGDPKKPAIVFIHGISLSCVVFDNIFLETDFLKDFYLVRYDMRGHGRTVKPDTIEGYSSKLYADDFAAVCDTFGVTKPVLVGWSLGATVLADVAAHLPKDYLSGAVYIAAAPYIGPIMQAIGSPTTEGFLPGLFTEDANLCSTTMVEFTDSLFLKPEEIPWALKCQWMGMGVHQLPKHRTFILSRPQDPAGLHALGASGFPLLALSGAHDRQVLGDVVVKEMKPHFPNMEVHKIEKGGSHAVHYDNAPEVLTHISSFAKRVTSKVRSGMIRQASIWLTRKFGPAQ